MTGAEATRSPSRWAWLSLLPIGFGAWAPIYAGVRARVASWVALGVIWCAVALGGWIASTTSNSHGHHHYSALAGMLLIVSWVGAAATSFVIRPAYERRMTSPLLVASERAETRLRDRRTAQDLARRDPSLATEIGVGRPEIVGGTASGVVDVNNASAAALESLPDVSDALATRIIEIRARVGGFSSLEDLGLVLDLPGDLIEKLRDRVVFLPR